MLFVGIRDPPSNFEGRLYTEILRVSYGQL